MKKHAILRPLLLLSLGFHVFLCQEETSFTEEHQKLLETLRKDVNRMNKDRERDRSMMRGMEKRIKSMKINLSKMGDQVEKLHKRVNERVTSSSIKKRIDQLETQQVQVVNDVELYKETQLDVYSTVMTVKNTVREWGRKFAVVNDDILVINSDVNGVKRRLKDTNLEISELRMEMVEMFKDLAEDEGDGTVDRGEVGESEEGSGLDYKRMVTNSKESRDVGDMLQDSSDDNNGREQQKSENCGCVKFKKLRKDVRMLKNAVLDRDIQSKAIEHFKTVVENRLTILETNTMDTTQQNIIDAISNYVTSNLTYIEVTNKMNKNSQTLTKQRERILKNNNLVKQVEVRVIECNANLINHREKTKRVLDKFNKTLISYKQQMKISSFKNSVSDGFHDKTQKLNDIVSRFSNRLAHIEVKVLNETLKKCNKEHIDFYQDVKLREHDQMISNMQEANVIQKEAMSRIDRGLYRLLVDIKDNRKNIDSLAGQNKKMLSYVPQLYAVRDEVKRFQRHLPKDCSEVRQRGYDTSGVYVIHPTGSSLSVNVYCEMTPDDAWTVIQRRYDGSVSFSKPWKQYKTGFGVLRKEFWLGNEIIHKLTSDRKYSLAIEMYDTQGYLWTANYSDFGVGNKDSGYKLYLTGYTGNASDSLSDSNGMAFSTEDNDNDLSSTHCGMYYTDGWWYRHCHYCNLNGRYSVGMIWFNEDKSAWVEMTRTVMKIKPRDE